MRQTSRARSISAKAAWRGGDRGIVLLDLVIAMALLSLLVFMVLPYVAPGTSPSRLGAYASEVAALFKLDRTAAARTGREVGTRIDLAAKKIASGSSRRAVTLPEDVTLDVIASDACRLPEGQFAVIFAADGRTCGAVVSLAMRSLVWRIRINWLTGFIDVVPPQSS